MWKYLPEERRAEYAATDEEATRWVDALSEGRETDARRPPELSTRDNVARAIYTEVREGRGSPHGGVFLDISYLPPERVRRKLPSMYEQFKELADVDITTGPMEVGPTTHYVMGGIRVDAGHGRDDACRACTRRARSPAACTARTGWAATPSRTCSCSVPGPARRRPPTAAERADVPISIRSRSSPRPARARRAARAGRRRGPVRRSSDELQDLMQRARRHLPGRGRPRRGARRPRRAPGALGERRGSRAVGPTTRAGTSSSSCGNC